MVYGGGSYEGGAQRRVSCAQPGQRHLEYGGSGRGRLETHSFVHDVVHARGLEA